jgi:alanyl-tRNA synthetase
VLEARRLAAEATAIGGRRVVVETLDGWDAAGLKVVVSAATAAAREGILVVLFSASLPVTAIIAKSKDMATDTHALLQALVARFGGRCGGKPELVQGEASLRRQSCSP